MNCLAHARVGPATANRFRHHVIDLCIARVRMFHQQRAGGHDHSRLAETALRDVFFQPRALAWMTSICRQAFDRGEASAFASAAPIWHDRTALPFSGDRARAAHADAATELCSGEIEMIANDPQQRCVIIDFHRVLGAVVRFSLIFVTGMIDSGCNVKTFNILSKRRRLRTGIRLFQGLLRETSDPQFADQNSDIESLR